MLTIFVFEKWLTIPARIHEPLALKCLTECQSVHSCASGDRADAAKCMIEPTVRVNRGESAFSFMEIVSMLTILYSI